MNALWYLWKRTRINKFKKSLKKISTYVFAVLMIFYVIMIVTSLDTIGIEPSPAMIAATLTTMSFLMIPGNFCAYAKRKGLLFRNCDVHFMFPSPLTPKTILTYAYLQTTLTKLIFCLIFAVAGVFYFHVAIWRMLLYMLFSLALQNLYEGSFAMLMYGSEKLTEKSRFGFRVLAWSLTALLVVAAFFTYLKTGLDFTFILEFLNGAYVQFVPVIGWYVSAIHLIFMGPTVSNLIGTVLYLISFAILVTLAWKMECRGEYYEDALKFADDYEDAIAKQKQGNAVVFFGKKEKFKEAKVNWKGTGARAIFYRELLEYKKTKFGLLNLIMVANLLIGIGIAVLYYLEPADMIKTADFIALGAGVYVHFLFSSINGKWTKELNSPYTYMIPDNTFRKLMYVTLIPNLQNLIAGALIVIPSGFVMGVSPVKMLLMIVAYTIYASAKIYGHAVAEVLMGSNAIPVFRQWLELAIVGLGIGFAVLGGFLGYLSGSIVVTYLVGIVFMTLYVSIFVVLATLNFYHMEKD